MDFKDQLKNLSDRAEKMLSQIKTEEATKNALIMPFIQILGYDVFNPMEVNPEYIADIGIKKGEKVDYAIMKDGEPIILIECKHHDENLNVHNSQLFRYFHTCKAKFGILTNGIIYRFYTDLVEVNKMDEKPFLEVNITDAKDNIISELKKFHKSQFDVEQITNTASELKYSNEIKSMLVSEFNLPSEAFIKFFTNKVYDGRTTEKVLNQFQGIVKRTISHYISDLINERLKSALEKEEEKQIVTSQAETLVEDIKKIVTTDEEKEAFFILKSILRNKVEPGRIFFRDTQTYLNIILDDNIRKTVCRLYLNGDKKYLALFDDAKKEIKHEIKSLEDIYNHSNELTSLAVKFDSIENNA